MRNPTGEQMLPATSLGNGRFTSVTAEESLAKYPGLNGTVRLSSVVSDEASWLEDFSLQLKNHSHASPLGSHRNFNNIPELTANESKNQQCFLHHHGLSVMCTFGFTVRAQFLVSVGIIPFACGLAPQSFLPAPWVSIFMQTW